MPGAVEPRSKRQRILQEATEATEEMTFPLIPRMGADWMLQNPRPSAKSAVKIRDRIGSLDQSRLRFFRFLL
jgi:hypothetical protein